MFPFRFSTGTKISLRLIKEIIVPSLNLGKNNYVQDPGLSRNSKSLTIRLRI